MTIWLNTTLFFYKGDYFSLCKGLLPVIFLFINEVKKYLNDNIETGIFFLNNLLHLLTDAHLCLSLASSKIVVFTSMLSFFPSPGYSLFLFSFFVLWLRFTGISSSPTYHAIKLSCLKMMMDFCLWKIWDKNIREQFFRFLAVRKITR